MKIAVVKLSALGDIIHASIILQFLKKRLPSIEIDWVVDERFCEILKDQPLINELIILPLKAKKFKKCLELLLEARQNKYDFVIDLQGLIKSAIVSRILSKQVFGFDKNCLRENLASYLYRYKLSISYSENIIVRNLALAAYALNENFDKQDILFKTDCLNVPSYVVSELKESLLLPPLCVLFQVGSSVKNKVYPAKKLAFVAKELLKAYKDMKILLCWGSKEEFVFAKELIKSASLEHENIALAPKLSLIQLMGLTKCAKLVVGNDSGPTHLAFALNIPSITIFGATPSYRNSFETYINKSIDSGKYINATKLDKEDFCINQVDEKEVLGLAFELLDKTINKI